ncbi:MAG TPA: hypothetical protein VJU86_08455 [Pyrinomonadaceae bacterium]|nr:hypothetical protein [Pyrinomonadaceae bacterium]
MRYFVEIDWVEDHYQGLIHKGNPAAGLALPVVLLSPDTEITIRGTRISLHRLVSSLIAFQPSDLDAGFDERWQLELGQYLYDQIFGGINAIKREQMRGEKIEVRIVTQDEHINRLPWVLLADNGVFLSAAGWTVGFSDAARCEDYELPPSPRTLICIPQPARLQDTKAEAHLEAIEDLLSASDRLLKRNRNVRIVANWEEFTKATAEFQPHVLYYYGHGVGDVNTSRLVFTTGKRGERLDKPIVDVANNLRAIPGGPPLLAYLNCCLGDAGGLLGAGRQLRTFIPAVITNYTLAHTETAQAQGLSLLRSILLEAIPPHIAIAAMRSNLGGMNLSFKDIRWMTPLLHYQYDHWKSNQPQHLSRFERDAHWRFKLDRVRQFGQVAYQTTQMLRERKPRSLAYLWYGQEGQGIDLFHQRLKIELQDLLANTYLYEVRPEWPVELSNPHRSWENMLTEAFGVQSMDDIPARIRTQTRGLSGSSTLVYVRHQPVRSSKLINPRVLKGYLEWWDLNFVSLIEGQTFALLGVSFVVGSPHMFLRALIDIERISDLELNGTVLHILDEMERLSKKDLLDFLQTHNIHFPRQHRDRLLERILKDTQGDYEVTLEALKDVADRAWDFEVETDSGRPGADYNYD